MHTVHDYCREHIVICLVHGGGADQMNITFPAGTDLTNLFLSEEGGTIYTQTKRG